MLHLEVQVAPTTSRAGFWQIAFKRNGNPAFEEATLPRLIWGDLERLGVVSHFKELSLVPAARLELATS